VEGDTTHFSNPVAHHRQPQSFLDGLILGILLGRSVFVVHRGDAPLVFSADVRLSDYPGGGSHQPDGDEARVRLIRIRRRW